MFAREQVVIAIAIVIIITIVITITIIVIWWNLQQWLKSWLNRSSRKLALLEILVLRIWATKIQSGGD